MSEAPIRTWLAEPLSPPVDHALRRLARTEDVAAIAVMPDVHLAEDVCVGCVVATRRRILPAAIGSDLGCGMDAVRLDVDAQRIVEDPPLARRVLAQLERLVPALKQRGRPADVELPDALAARPLSAPSLAKLAEREGRLEFATLGRGNHFLELQRDDEGWLWLMVHSGSRALGPAIARHHRAGAATASGRFEALDAESDAGRAFLDDLDYAIDWAAASRAAMVVRVTGLLHDLLGASADATSHFGCTHNLVRPEPIGGETLWVHRKGAIPAAAGEPGIVPGSMGTASFHVAGRGCEAALRSSSHGAGRALARGEARSRIAPRELVRAMRGITFDERRAARLVDEAPGAYKDVGRVMRAQHELTRIVRRLRPVLNWKGA